jgi:glycosyltransferase involved in cell wall biosynthesis
MSHPLVSLLIVTADRPRLLRQSLYYASRQTYPHCEVIVVDDGAFVPTEAQLREWCPRWPVRYMRTKTLSIGWKRNIGCYASEAEYIAHWDDDDWYPTDRIAKQVALLERTGKGITGTPLSRVYSVPHRTAADTRLDGSVQGNTLFYRRRLQVLHPFWDQSWGEDQQFFHLNAGERAVETDLELVLYMMHGRNVTGANPRFEWHPALVPVVERLLGTDLAFYEALRRDLSAHGDRAHAMLSERSPSAAAPSG